MANLNNLESPSKLSTTNTQIIGAGYTLPSGFNNLRQPDELSVLYAQNSDAIYNKYKLETNNSGLLRFGPKQPFITVNPNNARKGVNGLKRYESRALPIGSALQDVARISKFSVSGNGVIFLGKQLILQGLNSFNETKLYNPLMPILASTSIASFGLITPPTRHIEPNLGGVLGALGLGAVSNALGLNKPTPPKGTVGAGALPINAGDGGKGLIRGSTASQANKNFQSKWQGSSSTGFSLSAIGNFFKANTLFGAFSAIKQPNDEKYKVGESTYGIMASSTKVFEQPSGTLKHTFDKKVIQKWYAGTNDNTVRKGDTDKTTGVRGRYFRQSDGTYLIIGKRGPWEGTSIGTFPKLFGKEVELSLSYDSYQMYGKAVGNNISPNQEFKNSEMLINLAYYFDPKQNYPTNYNDVTSFTYYDANGKPYVWGTDYNQRWFNGANPNKKEKNIFIFNKKVPYTSTYFDVPIGYDPKDTDLYRKYGDNVGIIPLIKEGNQSAYTKSDILSIYKIYLDTDIESGTSNKQSTKFTDKNSDAVKNVEDNLKQVINNIKSAGYKFEGETDDDLINPQFSDGSLKGYDYINKLTKNPDAQKQKVNPLNYNKGAYLRKFAFGKRKLLLDDIEGKGFSGANRNDKINLFNVLDKTEFKEKYSEDSDLIKFYFHDLVNDKYIPFRATVTGLNENLNADWTAVEYIGRADKLQSYKGFSRGLSFKFNVVANSIKELLPMWQRINYLVGLTKPANYTQGDQNNPSNIYSRFIIPPLVKFTIGDIYKNQPGVIKSIGMNIPDNCVWETLSEEYAEKNDWSYLNGALTPSGMIQWTDSKGKYAQFPRECELNLSMDLLEKERPIVGGNNFGDSVRQLNAQGEYINPNNNNDLFSRKILVVDEQSVNNQVPA